MRQGKLVSWISKPVHPESAISGDEGKRAETTAELARAVDKGVTD